MITLRPHQVACVEALNRASDKFAFAEVTVAGGKSLIMAALAGLKLPGRTLTLAHTRELVMQNAEACEQMGLDVGVCCDTAGQVNIFGKVTSGSPGTVITRLHGFRDIEQIIVDEAHRISPNPHSEYRKIFAAFPDLRVRAVSGTGFRADKSGSLENSFGPCVYRYGYQEALADGFVKPLRSAKADASDASLVDLTIDVEGLKETAGEWTGGELTKRAIALAPLHARAAAGALHREGRRRALFFATDIDHADALEKELRSIQVNALAAHSRSGNRDEAVRLFRSGELPALISVMMFNTGFNVPDIDALVFCRPIKSPVLWVQSLGRGARVTPHAEDGIVLDFGGNIFRHRNDPAAAAFGLEEPEDVRRKRVEEDDDTDVMNPVATAIGRLVSRIIRHGDDVVWGTFRRVLTFWEFREIPPAFAWAIEQAVMSAPHLLNAIAGVRGPTRKARIREYALTVEPIVSERLNAMDVAVSRFAKFVSNVIWEIEGRPESERDTGQDLTESAYVSKSAKVFVARPTWFEVVPGSVPTLDYTHKEWHVKTPIGPVAWRGLSLPVDLTHVYVYQRGKQLVALGGVDKAGVLHQA